MALHIAVFHSDLRLEGVAVFEKPSMIIGQPPGQPSLVISQRWYERAGVAANEDIERLLRNEGFLPVRHSYFGWYRPADGIVIVDAKPDNFVRTDVGIVPIDLQMAQFSPEQLRIAGLAGTIEDLDEGDYTAERKRRMEADTESLEGLIARIHAARDKNA